MSERETCKGTKTNGEPCPSPFINERGYCDAHDPDTPEGEMAERGRRGVEVVNARRRQADDLLPDELPELEDLDDAKQWLDTLGRAVATGRIERREADPAIRAVQAWVETHSEALVDDQLEALRQRMENLEAEGAKAAVGRRTG